MNERICIDCALVAANGEAEGAPEGFIPTGNWSVDFTRIEDDSEEFYSPHVPCPSCGTMLAGTYFHAERIES